MSSALSTQPLPEEWSAVADKKGESEKYGYIITNSGWYEVPVGETKIGRDASLCAIVLDDETISKVHAVFESEGPEDTFIYDVGSVNKTKMGKMTLKPHCRYKINDKDVIKLGSLNVQFTVMKYKIMSSIVQKSQVHSLGQNNVLDKENINPPVGNDNKSSTKSTTDVYNSPSVSMLRGKPKTNKCYYLPADASVPGTSIFSQATQCEITNKETEINHRTDKNQAKNIIDDDDIYNLSTQCEYAVDFFKPKDMIASHGLLLGASKGMINWDFNDSGTFDFVKGDKLKYHIFPNRNKSFNEDIFELETQCEIDESNALNFRNKINLPTNLQESETVKLNGNQQNLSPKNDVEEELATLSDGEDQKLCDFMRIHSPIISTIKDSSVTSSSNLTGAHAGQNDVSDEIFDVVTQVPTTNDENNKEHQGEENRAMSTGVACTTVSRPDEDMILTQAFPHHIREINPESSIAEKGNNQDKDIPNEKTSEGNANLEDMISTQLFKPGNRENGAVRHFSQDDIATQIFPSEDRGQNSKQNDENQILSVIIEEPPPKPVPDVMLCDSGDETESDLEIKLCLEVKSKKVSTKQEIESERPLSACSDKTASDLDLAEVREINIMSTDLCEDLIPTQIFPTKTNGNTNQDILKQKECEDLIPTQIFPIEDDRKSLSAISDKTESDIVVDTRPATEYEVFCEDQDCIIEDNSNDSESLIKNVEERNSPSPILITSGREVTPSREEPETESTITRQSLSEVDEFIGKTYEKSDSGIGSENLLDVPEKGKGKVGPDGCDSDETDCEEELKEIQNRLKRQETFVVTKPNTNEINDKYIKNLPSTSKQSTCKKFGRGCRTVPPEPKTTIKSYFPPKASDSPLKRTMMTNSDETVPKKKVRSIQKPRKRWIENMHTDADILTQSLKLRNRVIRPATDVKAKTPLEKKTPGSAKTNAPRQKGRAAAVKKLIEEFEEDTANNPEVDPKVFTKIVFTGFESDIHDRIIHKLGGEKVNRVDDGHVLVSDRVRRTVKFLSAVALGIPIVSPMWLTASDKEAKFLNPWEFLLEDRPSEDRWGFNLKATLERWRKQKLLRGYTVFATENARPPLDEILSIAKCCGGTPVTSPPDVWPEKSIVLTCVEDKKLWPPYKCRHVKIVHYEFLLSGVLKYYMDFKSYKLR